MCGGVAGGEALRDGGGCEERGSDSLQLFQKPQRRTRTGHGEAHQEHPASCSARGVQLSTACLLIPREDPRDPRKDPKGDGASEGSNMLGFKAHLTEIPSTVIIN